MGQGKDCTTGCFLDYEYIKNHRLVVVDLRRSKELDADPKTIQYVEFVGQLKKKMTVKTLIVHNLCCFNDFR